MGEFAEALEETVSASRPEAYLPTGAEQVARWIAEKLA